MFGVPYAIEWLQPDTLDRLVGLRHAEMQHEFCGFVNEHLRRTQMSQKKFVEGDWFNLDRLRRCLTGHRWLSIDDMLRVEAVIGPTFTRMKFPKTPVTHPALIEKYSSVAGGVGPAAADGRPRA